MISGAAPWEKEFDAVMGRGAGSGAGSGAAVGAGELEKERARAAVESDDTFENACWKARQQAQTAQAHQLGNRRLT